MSRLWIMALLLLSACAHTNPAVNTDSFCLTYEPIIQAKGDGSITAALSVKRRILANEKFYHEVCPGAKK